MMDLTQIIIAVSCSGTTVSYGQTGGVIQSGILKILVECCRYAYLSNSEKHPITFYIERDKLEQETGRKTIKRIIDYVNAKYDVEEKRIKETIGEQILKTKDTEPIKTKNNRYREY